MPKSFLQTYWKSTSICVIIFLLSVIKFSEIPDAVRFRYSDKLVHALMYAVWAFVLYHEYFKDDIFKRSNKKWGVFLILFPIFFGALIEIVQGTIFRPRSAEFMDWIADIVGLSVGFIIAKAFIRTKRNG